MRCELLPRHARVIDRIPFFGIVLGLSLIAVDILLIAIVAPSANRIEMDEHLHLPRMKRKRRFDACATAPRYISERASRDVVEMDAIETRFVTSRLDRDFGILFGDE